MMHQLLQPLDGEDDEDLDMDEALNPQIENVLKRINLTHELSSDHNQSALHVLDMLLKNQRKLRISNERLMSGTQKKIKPKDLLGADDTTAESNIFIKPRPS
jgi:thiamine phosphate synthase YjbQ (UPF0047 family)